MNDQLFSVEARFSMPDGQVLGAVRVTGTVEGTPILPQLVLINKILEAISKIEGITEVKQIKDGP